MCLYIYIYTIYYTLYNMHCICTGRYAYEVTCTCIASCICITPPKTYINRRAANNVCMLVNSGRCLPRAVLHVIADTVIATRVYIYRSKYGNVYTHTRTHTHAHTHVVVVNGDVRRTLYGNL